LVALAVDAQAGPGHDVQALEGDLAAAVGAHAEALGLAVERAERVVDPVDEPALLAREEETLLLLDRVRRLIREVQRVQREVAITAHARVARILVEAGEHLECPLAFAQQPLLQVCPLLLGHLRLARSGGRLRRRGALAAAREGMKSNNCSRTVCVCVASAAWAGVVPLRRRGQLGIRVCGLAEQADGLAGLAEPASVRGLGAGWTLRRVGFRRGTFPFARCTLRVRRGTFPLRACRRRTGFGRAPARRRRGARGLAR